MLLIYIAFFFLYFYFCYPQMKLFPHRQKRKLFFLPPKNEWKIFFVIFFEWFFLPATLFCCCCSFLRFVFILFIFNSFFVQCQEIRRTAAKRGLNNEPLLSPSPLSLHSLCNCCLSSSYMQYPIPSSASKKLCNIIQNLNIIFWLL